MNSNVTINYDVYIDGGIVPASSDSVTIGIGDSFATFDYGCGSGGLGLTIDYAVITSIVPSIDSIYNYIDCMPIGSYLIGNTTTYATSGTACSNFSSLTNLYTKTPRIDIGDVLYSDSTHLTEFNGGNQWITMTPINFDSPGTTYVLQVSIAGVILNKTTC